MWITLYDSFLSIVAYDNQPPQPNMLYVRARLRGDIEKIFPDVEVVSSPSADYAYRAIISRGDVARAVEAEIQGITYMNFKKSVPERDRHDAYFKFWTAMRNLQTDRKNLEDVAHRGHKQIDGGCGVVGKSPP